MWVPQLRAWMFVLLAGCRIGFEPRAVAGDASGDGALEADAPVTSVLEAEDFTSNVPVGAHIWELLSDSAGYRGAGFMQVTPNDNGSCFTTIVTACSALSYQVVVPPTEFWVQVRARSFNVDEDSVWYGLDGVVTDQIDIVEDGNWNWSRGPTAVTTSPGVHTLTLWFREAGIRVDQIALTRGGVSMP